VATPLGPPVARGHRSRPVAGVPAATSLVVPQVNGVYAVLQGLSGGNPLLGGYGYLEWSALGGAYHEGMDLNSLGGGDADLGALVVAPVAGRVQFVGYWDGRSTGFGNHAAVWLDAAAAAPRCYVHVAHLDTVTVLQGQQVVAGQQLGTCGKSGHQTYAHVHTALWYDVPPGGNWNFWQAGYPKEWVAAHTLDPEAWFWATAARAGELEFPTEVAQMLTGAQRAAVQAALWGSYWDPAQAEFALPTAWRDEWVAGRYRGRPLAAEQDIPASEDRPAGRYQPFELGIGCWLPGHPVSWNG
jgi:murein DD-endopeptidase MepM/ murein hydrolase activator NlpD